MTSFKYDIVYKKHTSKYGKIQKNCVKSSFNVQKILFFG